MITELLSRYSELLSITCVFIAAPADLYLIVCAIDRWQRAEHHATHSGSRRRERLHRRLAAYYVLGIIVITSLASLVLLCLR